MFTTFKTTTDKNQNQVATSTADHSTVTTTAASLTSTSTTTATATSAPPRPKRSQVARACDWCRQHRIKCDTHYPCRNCQDRGEHCSKKNARSNGGEIRTLPRALSEIERLRQEVKELKTRLEDTEKRATPRLTGSFSRDEHQDGNLTPSQSFRYGPTSKKRWEGIQTRTAQSHQTQWYGSSSAFYFIGQMTAYLAASLGQSQIDHHHLQPNSASRAFTSPTSPKQQAPAGCTSSSTSSALPTVTDVNQAGSYLSGVQEDYFLGHFWQSYHCTYQIVDEAEFREHYRSLWADSPSHSSSSSSSPHARRPSALVDIILALCMQYALAFLPRDKDRMPPRADDVGTDDASIAGRWYYRRSQCLLASELESPSITTLQCHIFSVVYLCNASFQNMAHSTLALAVRTAHILGLHLDPPEELPREKRELRRRLWWTLCAVEGKTCMKLGRPLAVPDRYTTCQLPAADHELALLSGSNFASYGDNVTWLTYNLLSTKLVLTVEDIYTSFYDRCADLIGANGGYSLYNDIHGLETCAKHLHSLVDDGMQAWLLEVPEALKTQRKNGGDPFSFSHSSLDVERFAPLWLQRQRLILELLYHNLSMNLFRRFIRFPSTTSITSETAPPAITDFGLPNVTRHVFACVMHAITITHILREVLTDTDILSGWYEAFQWQWNATLVMVGFIVAYPDDSTTPTARAAIDDAIAVFETYGSKFAVAASAASVTRDLTAKADVLIDRPGRPESTSVSGPAALTPASLSADSTGPFPEYGQPNLTIFSDGTIIPGEDDDPSAMFQNTLAGAMGLTDTTDSFYSFEPLFAGSWNMADAWASGQDQAI